MRKSSVLGAVSLLAIPFSAALLRPAAVESPGPETREIHFILKDFNTASQPNKDGKRCSTAFIIQIGEQADQVVQDKNCFIQGLYTDLVPQAEAEAKGYRILDPYSGPYADTDMYRGKVVAEMPKANFPLFLGQTYKMLVTTADNKMTASGMPYLVGPKPEGLNY